MGNINIMNIIERETFIWLGAIPTESCGEFLGTPQEKKVL